MTETLHGSSIVRALVAKYAYTRRTEPFTLSSGVISYDYIDAKQILLVNEFQAKVGAEMARVIEDRRVSYFAVGGLELGAIYVAQALLLHEWSNDRERASSFVVRKKEKAHGKGAKIEGPNLRGQPVIIVDDIVTTGRSIIQAIDAVRTAGGVVILAITLVDRGESAKAKLAAYDVDYAPLTTYQDFGLEPVPAGE